jgi:hypothetical protein
MTNAERIDQLEQLVKVHDERIVFNEDVVEALVKRLATEMPQVVQEIQQQQEQKRINEAAFELSWCMQT